MAKKGKVKALLGPYGPQSLFWPYGPKMAFALPFLGRFGGHVAKTPFWLQKWRFWPLLLFLAVYDTRWWIWFDIDQTSRFSSAKHLPRQIFSEIDFWNVAKITFLTRTAKNHRFTPKICDVRAPDSKTSFYARDFTLPARRAKVTEKFRVSPPTRSAVQRK